MREAGGRRSRAWTGSLPSETSPRGCLPTLRPAFWVGLCPNLVFLRGHSSNCTLVTSPYTNHLRLDPMSKDSPVFNRGTRRAHGSAHDRAPPPNRSHSTGPVSSNTKGTRKLSVPCWMRPKCSWISLAPGKEACLQSPCPRASIGVRETAWGSASSLSQERGGLGQATLHLPPRSSRSEARLPGTPGRGLRAPPPLSGPDPMSGPNRLEGGDPAPGKINTWSPAKALRGRLLWVLRPQGQLWRCHPVSQPRLGHGRQPDQGCVAWKAPASHLMLRQPGDSIGARFSEKGSHVLLGTAAPAFQGLCQPGPTGTFFLKAGINTCTSPRSAYFYSALDHPLLSG